MLQSIPSGYIICSRKRRDSPRSKPFNGQCNDTILFLTKHGAPSMTIQAFAYSRSGSNPDSYQWRHSFSPMDSFIFESMIGNPRRLPICRSRNLDSSHSPCIQNVEFSLTCWESKLNSQPFSWQRVPSHPFLRKNKQSHDLIDTRMRLLGSDISTWSNTIDSELGLMILGSLECGKQLL